MNRVQLSQTTYVLRLTQIRRGGEVAWRYVLIPAGDKEAINFRNLVDLVTYIEKQTAQQS